MPRFYNIEKRYIGFIVNYQTNNNFTSKIYSTVWLIGRLPMKIKCLNNPDGINEDNDNDEKVNDNLKIYLGCDYYDGNFKDSVAI